MNRFEGKANPSDVLLFLGVPEGLKGSRCIIAALPYVKQRLSFSQVYEAVGRELDIPPCNVERNIRSAANTSADRLAADGLVSVYGGTLKLTGVPTNSQLLLAGLRFYEGMAPYGAKKIL